MCYHLHKPVTYDGGMTRTRTPQATPTTYDEATLTELGARRAAAQQELAALTPLIREQIIAGAREGRTAYRLAQVAGMTTSAASEILRNAGVPTVRGRRVSPAA